MGSLEERLSTLHCHCIFPWVQHFKTSQRHKMGSGVDCSYLNRLLVKWIQMFKSKKYQYIIQSFKAFFQPQPSIISRPKKIQKVVAMLSTSCPQAVALLLFRSSSCLSTVKELFTTSSPKSQSISDVQTLVNNDGTWVQWKSIRQLYWRLKSWDLSSIVHLKKRNRK